MNEGNISEVNLETQTGVADIGLSSNALWQSVLGEVELICTPQSFRTFWLPTKLISFNNDKLLIEVNNIFAKTQFEKKFAPLINDILKKHGLTRPQLEFITSSTKRREHNEDVMVVETSKKSSGSTPAKFESRLNSRFTFDNFIVGSCNDLAYAAAGAVAEHPGEKYNPIFIYGGVGLGKTHLIQAIGNKITGQWPAKRVLYASTEEFVNDFIHHLRSKTVDEFTRKYRDIDALIIDDMQFIAGKEKNQEAFFNTFNALHQASKQIIIAADRPPANIPTLTDRLKSRLLMGMAIDVNLPDYETRVAIIELKAAHSSVQLPRETAEYLAENIKTNVRELEGSLNYILANAEMRGIEPTPEFAAELLANSRTARPKHITARQIIEKTARYFELKPADICSPARDKYIVLPRQIAMYLLRSELHMSYPKIANELGRKDHTTALHSIEKIDREIKLDITIREKVAEIREVIYA
ncbi:chromosomal replication initiator protein DnaA [Candidatus Saccharibacteria bacterium]|nr:chromosomal replication initiator protein DnaA [Candidatus Saccharibacteria bacterium]